MAKVDQNKLARYRELALTYSDEFDGRETDYSGIGPDVSSFLERIQKDSASIDRDPFKVEQTEGMFLAPRTRRLEGAEIACVGIPMDKAESTDHSGARHAPRAVRFASAAQGEIHEASGLNVFKASSIIDWGDIELNGEQGEFKKNIDKIASVYENFAQQGVSPLTVGGAHISTYGILKGLTRNGDSPVALIHLDAHHKSSGDRYGPRLNDAGFLRLATVQGLIDPECSVQAGLRGQGLSGLDFSRQTGMEVITARDFQYEGAEAVAKKVRNAVGEMPCYLSIDASVFDCGLLPTSRLTVPFGLCPREVRQFLEGLCGIDLVGADIMELSPDYETACVSSALASAIAFEMLGILSVAVSAREKKVLPFPTVASDMFAHG